MFENCYKVEHYSLKRVIESEIFKNPCESKKEYACKKCDEHLKNGKMPHQVQENGLALNPRVEELEDFCPLELMLISKITLFMRIVPKHKRKQFSLKVQCALSPADLKKLRHPYQDHVM